MPVDQHSLRLPSALLIESPLAGRDVTWNHLVHSSVSTLLIDISRKGSHFLESSISRQKVSNFVVKVRSSGVAVASHPRLIHVKLSSQL
ncbi:hypothetical protein AVEN_153131-1 [Araneus ventricosus]|uniref:Uncharacterized protein n=1 Tax=Araneus ventricosus TaxID=182803 RepID=A0A4Y2IGM5_ARAVE|nr:hypothetical protein AVEN_153131-1 [Araneus ventricosus]